MYVQHRAKTCPAVVLYIQTVEAGSQRRKVRTAWVSGRSISQLINGRGETLSNKRRNKNKNKNSDIFSLEVCGSKVFTRTSGLGGKDEALGGVGLVSLMRRHMHNCVYYMYGACICRYVDIVLRNTTAEQRCPHHLNMDIIHGTA